jgi:UDP-glucuronate 4-epimerase
MKLCVTGVSGFLGFHVARVALERGFEVLGVARSAGTARMAKLTAYQSFRFAAGDVAEYDVLRRLLDEFRPQAIVHAASLGVLRWAPASSYDVLKMNVLAGAEVGRGAATLGCPVVFIGSASEYSPSLEPIAEDYSTANKSAYAVAKNLAWRAFLQAAGDAVPSITLRPFQLYGPDDYPQRFPMAALLAPLGRAPNQFGDPTLERDFVYVDDAADVVLAAAAAARELGARRPLVLNLSTGVATSLGEFARLAARAVGAFDFKHNFTGRPPGGAPDFQRLVGRTEATAAALGSWARTDVATGLARIVEVDGLSGDPARPGTGR